MITYGVVCSIPECDHEIRYGLLFSARTVALHEKSRGFKPRIVRYVNGELDLEWTDD